MIGTRTFSEMDIAAILGLLLEDETATSKHELIQMTDSLRNKQILLLASDLNITLNRFVLEAKGIKV